MRLIICYTLICTTKLQCNTIICVSTNIYFSICCLELCFYRIRDKSYLNKKRLGTRQTAIEKTIEKQTDEQGMLQTFGIRTPKARILKPMLSNSAEQNS